MRIFVLEDDFSQQTRIETTIEKLLKAHHIIPSSFEVFGKPDQLLAEVHEKGGPISYSFWILRFEMKR
ncbi:response regulator [Streptococcus pneumoniae]|nr:response regulator [Streptococcus pneumoniae]